MATKKSYPQKETFPLIVSDGEVLSFLQTKDIDSGHINFLKEMSGYTDDVISSWLDINVKTLRSYKNAEAQLKDNIKERVILLISLMNHGISVFGDNHKFDKWLNAPNFFLDGKTPFILLHTVTGIRFVNDRLTSMEFGENS